jgi:hypothetical protein
LVLINNKLFKELLELLSLLEARVMAQPNKADFDVRKVLKRKKASRDCMTSSEHGEFCIKRCKISSDVCFMRLFSLFPAKITSLLRTSRIAPPTTTRTQTSIKIVNLTLSESL